MQLIKLAARLIIAGHDNDCSSRPSGLIDMAKSNQFGQVCVGTDKRTDHHVTTVVVRLREKFTRKELEKVSFHYNSLNCTHTHKLQKFCLCANSNLHQQTRVVVVLELMALTPTISIGSTTGEV